MQMRSSTPYLLCQTKGNESLTSVSAMMSLSSAVMTVLFDSPLTHANKCLERHRAYRTGDRADLIVPPATLFLATCSSAAPIITARQTDITVMSFRAYEGVDARDFANSQAPSATCKDISNVSAFAEYARFITDAHDLRSSAQKTLSSLLEGASSEAEHDMARDIISAMSTVLKINIALHLKSRGLSNIDRVLQVNRPRIQAPTRHEQAVSAIYGPEPTLPPDFSLYLLKRLHGFASGRETGTITYRDEVLTVEADMSKEPDLCRIMDRPETVDELRACKLLWMHSASLERLVEACVEVDKHLTRPSADMLVLSELATTVKYGSIRKRLPKLPYDASPVLRCLDSVASGLAHMVLVARSTGKGTNSETESS